MKNRSYILKFCLVVCLALLLTACGGESAPDWSEETVEGDKELYNGTQEQEWVYLPEVITVGDERADYGRMQPVGNTLCYVQQGGETVDDGKNICRYSLTDQKLTRIPVDWPEGGKDWDVGARFFAQDSLYLTANVYPADYGSMKRFLCKFDLEGNCLFSREITEQAGRDVSLRGLTADEQGRLYLFLDSGELLFYTGDGDYHGSVKFSDPESLTFAWLRGSCDGADGKFYVCIGQESVNLTGQNMEEKADVRCSLMEVDFENARLAEAAGNLPDINGICRGLLRGDRSAGQEGDSDVQGSGLTEQDGDPLEKRSDSDSWYDLLLWDDWAVYGYRFDAQKNDSSSLGEKLFTWMDCDINGYCVTNLYLLEDGRLCADVEDWLNDDRVVVTLKRAEAEQAPKREELTLVTVNGGSDLSAMAVKFNRGSSRYHLTVKSYESLTDLYNAVLAKKPMDLIDLSGVNVRRLAAQGLLEDLAPYVERSERFGRSDFVDGLLDVYTFDSILAGIPAEFMLQTVVGNGALLENKAGLTLEELYALADRYPGAKAFDGMTREEMMQYIMLFQEDTFLDWEAGVCHFDSEEFQDVLEYVGQFTDSGAVSAGTVSAGGGEESLSSKMKRGEVLFAVKEATPYMLWDYRKLFEGNAACVGFPTADGRGGHLLVGSDAYAIAAVSEHKESAWSFIEEALTREKSELYAELWLTYPALRKTLDKRAEAAIARDQFTWDDVNAALELVPDATPFFSAREDPILQIILEEAPAYYSGQKRVEDVMKVIQNRAQLYVDENPIPRERAKKNGE
ncbi:MAG: extracellular solute-binding protein [Roseburia sp.]|nr:extracellular solute-binding protein [Roseburia sp.]MCM1099356.1 extracellular solute-binding protein [Ruminococcus flavefaciens]